MSWYAKVILDSIGPWGNRLTTMEFTLPKLWLAEFNTHCAFARNSASTRAIPYREQRRRVLDDPFVPFEWPLEGKGMAHSQEVRSSGEISILGHKWKLYRDRALEAADDLVEFHHIHKQLAGRLLEPWQFQTVLATGDQAAWANFFYLRRSNQAAPEIHRAADLLWEAYSKSEAQELLVGEWHAPLLQVDEPGERTNYTYYEFWRKWTSISAARCARLSYLTHHGVRAVAEDLALFGRLTTNRHWSPLEHVCQAKEQLGADTLLLLEQHPELAIRKEGKWDGWRSLRSTYTNEYMKEYKEVLCAPTCSDSQG